MQVGRPPRAAAGDFVDDVIDWTEDMPVPVKRRVAALREVQKDYDNLMQQFVKERAELLAKYQKQAGGLLCQEQSHTTDNSARDRAHPAPAIRADLQMSFSVIKAGPATPCFCLSGDKLFCWYVSMGRLLQSLCWTNGSLLLLARPRSARTTSPTACQVGSKDPAEPS
jgi:hypothetical protein